jgi:hypothetical protein
MNTEEVLSGISTNTLLKKNDMLLNGEYEQEKASARDKLRYEERQIRKYKQELETNKIMLERTPQGQEREDIKKEIERNNANIRTHQYNAREIVKQNSSFLERQYTRENPRLIKTDLGVKYHAKYYKN